MKTKFKCPPLFIGLKPGNYEAYRYELKSRGIFRRRTENVLNYIGIVSVASTGGITMKIKRCRRRLSKANTLWTIDEVVKK